MKKNNFLSEDGAALVLEATIVYPITLVAVVFLIIWGLTYVQSGYLNFASAQVSHYISKTIVYPGYQYLDEPYADFEYKNGSEFGDSSKWTIQNRVELAMDEINPYRYLFGLDGEIKEIMANYDDHMVEKQLPNQGFLKAEKGIMEFPAEMKFQEKYKSANENGYLCGIDADSNSVSVFLGQKFVFSNLFRMIGLGGKTLLISGYNTSYTCDSVEVLRNTDMLFEVIDVVAGKLGFNFDKMNEVLEMFK